MTDFYLRPAAGEIASSELEIKRSRFLGFITRAETEEEARDFIHQIKSTYPDARHHCSAFICQVDQAVPIERSSDDGEPSGTAGKPMLEVLKGSALLDIVAVSVRYFGGVKLGTGGLVRAYSDSVTETLLQVNRTRRSLRELYRFDVDFAQAGRLEAELRARDVAIVDLAYDSRARFVVGTAPGGGERLAAVLAELSSGGIAPKEAGTQWIGE
ncbi:YigZ family protein [Corynebacterium epidermidicanis]|uniref:YigZ family protein n=1 Tax=Corynebacterium epidermidicanis TaxID=1050174 RepID=UPI0006416594|nr:YigZ family protein [Corynebacterium epidermidicanis]